MRYVVFARQLSVADGMDARVGKRQCAMREAPTRDCEGLARARPFAFVEYTTHAGVLTGTPGTCLHSADCSETHTRVF